MYRIQRLLCDRLLIFALLSVLYLGCGHRREKPERAAGAAPVADFAGDVALLRLQAPAFDELSLDQKCAAYYLSQAILAGRDIPGNQINLRSTEIRLFLENIRLYAVYAAPDYYVKPFENYLKEVWVHSGFYDLSSGIKLPPQFGGRELAQLMFLALANSGGQLGDLLDVSAKHQYIIDTLFNPSLDSTLFFPATAIPPDFVLNFPQGFYDGVEIAEARAFPSKYPHNSRLLKRPDGIREIAYRTGDDELAPGLFAPELEKVVDNLEKARPYLTPSRVVAVDHLVQHLRTGRPAEYDSAAAIWCNSSAPLDFVLGFMDLRFDPLGNKGLWTGLLFMPDDFAQARLDRLQELAGELISGLPLSRSRSSEPIEKIKVAQLLTAIGANGPLCPDVFRDPPDARLESPRQSIIFTNVLVARARAKAALAFYAGSADSAQALQYAGEAAFAETALREVLGLQGDSPRWNRHPSAPLEIVSAIQQQLIPLGLIYDPRLIRIGLLFNEAAQNEVYQRFARRYLAEQDLSELNLDQRARRVIGSALISAGALKIESGGERHVCRVVDGKLMNRRILELLAEVEQVMDAPDPSRAAADFMDRYQPPEPALEPAQISGETRRPEAVSQMAFILPMIEAEFNSMGGIENVRLQQPADFAEEMFLWGGHELPKDKVQSK